MLRPVTTSYLAYLEAYEDDHPLLWFMKEGLNDIFADTGSSLIYLKILDALISMYRRMILLPLS